MALSHVLFVGKPAFAQHLRKHFLAFWKGWLLNFCNVLFFFFLPNAFEKQCFGTRSGASEIEFDNSTLRRLGVVAIGREMEVTLAVASVSFYRVL